ncbi:MAG: tetratricopeptide repeat protein [Pyrinomonadaceae bacterium]
MSELAEGTIKWETGSVKGRLAMAAIVAAALVFTWFAVRWQIGNMLGELTSPAQPNSLEVARAAMGLAPGDPLARSLYATKLKEEFSEESIANSVANFEEVVRLSPNDYRWWIELGRAYEQAERLDEAEMAFKRAVELAPAYTFPQWQIGNFYLRRDRAEEAFTHLTRATEKSIVFREQVFALAWDYFDKDPAEVERLAADTPGTRVTLAQFYAARGAADDAIRVWNSIPEAEQARHPQIIKNIVQYLYSKRFYRQTLEFSRKAGIDADAEFEKISNPGFEKFLGDSENVFFSWRINRSDSKLEIGTDSSARAEGQRSLKITFKNYAKPELYNVSQLVAVEPLGRYRISFMLRVENLRTGGEPIFEIVDAKNDVSLVRSQRFPLGSQDWQPWSLEFVVPEGCDGVTIRTTRESCGENCPISGTIWYDAFNIERL